jgi:hypothetical protein
MRHLLQLWRWLVDHWELWGIPSAIATTVGIPTVFYKLQKARAEAKIAKRKEQQDKLALQIKASSQLLCIYADTMKKREGLSYMEFSEEMLRHTLGREGAYFHLAMDYLQKERKARKGEDPGWWVID